MKIWFKALIFAMLAPCSALAADIYITPSIDTSGRSYSGPWYADLDANGCQIYINGIIEDGDFEKIKSIYDQGITYDPSGGEWHASGPNICLDSPGGSLEEAIKIAALLKNSSSTTILPNARCESACSIIFMAGSINGQTSRSIYKSSKLGFHAPELILEESNYSAESVSKAYDLAIETTSKIVELQVLPIHALEMFTSTPYSSMRYIETVDDLLKAKIGLLKRVPTYEPKFFNELPDLSVEQLVANICEHSYRMQNNSFTEFAGYKDLSVTKSEITGTALIRGDHEDFTFDCNTRISIDNYGYCGSTICFSWGEVVSSYTSNPSFHNVLPFWNRQTKLSEMDRQVMSVSQFSSLIQNFRKLKGLQAVFGSYNAETRSYLQRTLRNLGLYSSSIDGKWGKGTEGAFQKLFDTMDEYYPDLKWREDFGFDDGVVTVNEFADFWNAAVGCGEDKMLRITNLCQ